MFGTFFCQNAYNRFAKSEDFKLDAQTLINKGQQERKREDMTLGNKKQKFTTQMALNLNSN